MKKNFHIITLFPEVIESYTKVSILGRAQKNKILSVNTYQLRDFAQNRWGKVDERAYGGGPGMILRAEPIVRAVNAIRKNKPRATVLIMSAGGKPFTNALARVYAKNHNDVIIVSGRYEGLDARVKKILGAQEISVGPYILTGGEIPALAVIDAVSRHIPGVLGKYESLEEGRVASHDVYTRPEILLYRGKKYRVPKVLLSGHHAKIDELRGRRRSLGKNT
ncbi:MAG: tRNA (guanosine(37)-N1)-methyltransferase TrmD [Patescibacteria group bacterium]|nr:tRNA (guanosine(37)-N1)-methyltransferase TrmD [Patescibacteria group bacterium]